MYYNYIKNKQGAFMIEMDTRNICRKQSGKKI